MNLLAYGIVLPWIVVGFGCWIGYLLIRQSGRILQRLEAVEARLGQLVASSPPALPPTRSSGLVIGAEAPSFELPSLTGQRTALAEFRGRRVLLIFFNPLCGFCAQMAAELAALPVEGAGGHPVPILVTTGDAEENGQFFAEHAIRCAVLLQEPGSTGGGGEIASRYQAGGTPMGYLIDERGRIASELAAGAEAIWRLWHGAGAAAPANGKREHQGNRVLSDSRIPRGGLPAGTPAPRFTLPLLDGGELSLEEYLGRKLLLLFSDPNCGPCDALVPRLETAYRRSGSVQLLMVSRGEREANRAKVKQHGITFPVVLQRHWEVSRQYAMFATPVGYLINEEGIIAAECATGADAVLKLLARTSAPATDHDARGPCRCGKLSRECDCRKREEHVGQQTG